jgi:hypothetical protein
VRISSNLVSDFALLTDTLDIDDVDLVSTFSLLTSDVAAAVSSYLGMSIRVRLPDGHLELTTLPDEDTTARIVTSLRIPAAVGTPPAGPSVVIVLFAEVPGAFVDLAADLAWLTGRDLGDVSLDADLGDYVQVQPATSVRTRSSIDQAVGVLIGRGNTAEAALVELDALASLAGTDCYAAALELLDALPQTSADQPDATE